jgi:sugar lactone lactonase YvrE
MAKPVRIECVAPIASILGEGPVWDERAGRIWWVDIKRPAVHAMAWPAGPVETVAVPERVGALGLREQGGLVLALKTGFAFMEWPSGRLERLGRLEPDRPGNRFNDGKCDAAGRFWAGSMDDAEREPTGDLYRLDPDGSVTRFAAGFVVTNGIGWSGDNRTMYFSDTVGRKIHAYNFTPQGRPENRRLFAELSADAGYPDGLCVDAADHVWGAHWGGSRITRYRPDGSIERVLKMPVPRPTSCCFGGPELDILFVTSARIDLSEAELARAPLSGGLFAVHGLGVKGLPMPRFGG